MSSNQNAPRKFSEKIAIMERKLNEDEDAFTKVMREVREITSGNPRDALQPGQWTGPGGGGSLPNMHESCSQSQPYWPEPTRGRSPGAHYHPYRAPRSQERVPPLHGTTAPYPIPQPTYGLALPPEQWNGVGRAQSAPSINMQMSSVPPAMSPYAAMSPYQEASQQSPIYNGSPVYNGGGSPVYMIPRPEDGRQEMAGSLPNIPPALPQMPGPSCYHAQVGQRHSTGCGTRLAPSYTPESQSAPTSPAQMTELNLPPHWPVHRHYSNSPEAQEIPHIVLTEADGLDGGRLDGYDSLQLEQPLDAMGYDLQDLRIEGSEMQMHMMCNGSMSTDPTNSRVYQ